MQLAEGVTVDNDDLAEICRRHHISRLALFGSALRNDYEIVGEVAKQVSGPTRAKLTGLGG